MRDVFYFTLFQKNLVYFLFFFFFFLVKFSLVECRTGNFQKVYFPVNDVQFFMGSIRIEIVENESGEFNLLYFVLKK